MWRGLLVALPHCRAWRCVRELHAGVAVAAGIKQWCAGQLSIGMREETIVFGIPVPSVDPVFLDVVRFHIVAAIGCVLAGVMAMLSRKGRGRHSSWGSIYYWCLATVVVTATGLSMVRWSENYHLFLLGTAAVTAATIARRALRQRWRNWVRLHIIGMGSSYILMLTAFDVDNGKQLPIWKELPHIAFWALPAGFGVPLLGYALLKHPLAQRERLTT